MADRPIIPLKPQITGFTRFEDSVLYDWPFADPFVKRILNTDIPQRILFNECRMWIYYDPDDQPVGFGTLDVCKDYASHTENKAHPYIPLLATNPNLEPRGYGTSILRHLIDEATLLACRQDGCHDVLFLDVYTTSANAIKLYYKFGFQSITPEPILDREDGDKPYLVMARRVSLSKS